MKMTKKRNRGVKEIETELHEYSVTLEASFQTTETATITVEAVNKEQAEEIAIAETQDGRHFGTSYGDSFEGSEGFYDADFEATNVERTDGEDDEDKWE